MVIWISAKQEAKNPDLMLWCCFQVPDYTFDNGLGKKGRSLSYAYFFLA